MALAFALMPHRRTTSSLPHSLIALGLAECPVAQSFISLARRPRIAIMVLPWLRSQSR